MQLNESFAILISRTCRASAILLLALCSTVANSQTKNLGVRDPGEMAIRIGSTGSTIDTVTFNIPPGQMGNGVPVAGTPGNILIQLVVRAKPQNSRTATLTVDSSIPMTNGSDTVPFTTISWVATDGDIPSGSFDGSSSQFLMSFINSRMVWNEHSFSYANSSLIPAGSYTGQVVYTLSMP